MEVVAEVHNVITAGSLLIESSVAFNLDVPKTTVFNILHYGLQTFPYRFQLVQMFQSGNDQPRIISSSEMMKIAGGLCDYYGRMRHSYT